jgi:hypothetical protein
MAQQAYTTVSDIKSYLGITSSTYDAFFTLIIPKAMAYIDKYTGRTFGWGNPASTSDLTDYKNITSDQHNHNGEVHDGLYGTKIYLRNCDIVSIEEIKVGNPSVGTPTTLASSQYIWRADGRVLLGGNWFDSTGFPTSGNNQDFYGLIAGGYQTITIKYHYGFYGVPEDIALACMDLCGALYLNRKSQGITGERLGNYQVNYDGGFRKALKDQPDVLGTLRGYKMVNL